jgi:hypothetical protein
VALARALCAPDSFRVVDWERTPTDAGRRKLALLLRLLRFRAAVKRLTWLAIDDCLSKGVFVPGVIGDEW